MRRQWTYPPTPRHGDEKKIRQQRLKESDIKINNVLFHVVFFWNSFFFLLPFCICLHNLWKCSAIVFCPWSDDVLKTQTHTYVSFRLKFLLNARAAMLFYISKFVLYLLIRTRKMYQDLHKDTVTSVWLVYTFSFDTYA